ncbi:TetR/AcrR family transcriptional regulator [Streptacidiphilus sp. PB12-B1b]|uniref:TetR/AcrR family transcriptional regulator n=1 Tax=Streptacidiphilus sp. PB12-B1b TaxID=2705012 RepID=UPI0015FBE2A8|nr:TetR/AcrR family transcriptional regulator [Streptacidiphilus sp. PB12-B1b]QMU78656.1 TetR/AcrR family transcriptional regulator [Streptacidiphilus sp. PB12-B1b]
MPTPAPAPGSAVRRRPVQRRSLERFGRILDACAELLDEVGYTGLTTKEVARRAAVPIGTLYQFFPGIEGLLGALAERNLEHYADRLAQRLLADPPGHTGDLVDLAVEEYVAMHRSVPGFGVVDFGAIGMEDTGSMHLIDADRDNNTVAADRLWSVIGDALLATRDPAAADPAGNPRLALRVALECADAVLRLAFRTDPEGDPALIDECRRLLRRYLA